MARRLIAFIAAIALIFTPLFGSANPLGGIVSSGSATINQAAPGILHVTQQSDKAILDWHSFSIGSGESTQFFQPSISSIALNRVMGGDPSVILGQLQANGRVFLLNSNGIIFGPRSQVNVGGILASTLNMNNSDFLNGYYHLAQDPAKALAGVVNQGQIGVSPGGSVALVAPLVYNGGTITAPAGHVGLGATTEALVSFDQGLINFMGPGFGANPGTVILPSGAVDGVLGNVVNNSAILPAGAVVDHADGSVSFVGAEGLAVHSGTISTDGSSGNSAGSVVVHSTQAIVLPPGSLITANGQGANANGGSIQILSDGKLAFDGTVQTKAGDSGNGGNVEMSDWTGGWINGHVDASATAGQSGNLLIDPVNTEIDSGGNAASDHAGGTEPSPTDTYVNVGTITGASSNVKISSNNSITWDDFNGTRKTVGGGHSLTLTTQTGPILFENTADTIAAAGSGSITINSGTTAGSGGSVTLGKLSTATGAVSVTADGDIAANNSVTTAGASITLTSKNGKITGTASTNLQPGGGVGKNLMLQARTGIGTSSQYLLANGSGAMNTILTGAGAKTFVQEKGPASLSISTNSGDVDIRNASNKSILSFISASSTLTASGVKGNTSFTNTGGNIVVNSITGAVDKNVNLMAPSGAITGGNITAPATLNANRVLLSALSIGTSGSPLTILSAPNLSATATSGSGFVGVSGSIAVQAFSAAAGKASLAAAGAITAASGETFSAITGNITAGTGIGTSRTPFSTSVRNLTVSTTGNGAKSFVTNTKALTSLTAVTNNGGSTVNWPSHSLLFMASSGALNANAVGTNISFNNTGGNLAIGSVTVGSGDSATLNASGAITEGVGGLITANNASLTAGTSIGTSGTPLSVTVGTLNATATSGSLFISDIGALTVASVSASSQVSISTTMDQTVAGPVTGATINLISNGNIFDPAADLTATGNVSLKASGVIGTQAHPFDVSASGGTALSAGGMQNGISGDLVGSGTVSVLSAPGEVFYNGACIFNCPVQPAPPPPPAPAPPPASSSPSSTPSSSSTSSNVNLVASTATAPSSTPGVINPSLITDTFNQRVISPTTLAGFNISGTTGSASLIPSLEGVFAIGPQGELIAAIDCGYLMETNGLTGVPCGSRGPLQFAGHEFILDGFPVTVPSASIIDALLASTKLKSSIFGFTLAPEGFTNNPGGFNVSTRLTPAINPAP